MASKDQSNLTQDATLDNASLSSETVESSKHEMSLTETDRGTAVTIGKAKSKREQRLYELAVQFGLVFLHNKFTPIKCSRLCHEYQARFRKNLTLRDYQCTRVEKLVEKLPVFEWDGELGPKTKVSLSKSLLVEFLFTPLLELSPSKTVKEEDVASCFKLVTGINVEVLYDIFEVSREAGKPNNYLLLMRSLVKLCSNFIVHQDSHGISYLTFRKTNVQIVPSPTESLTVEVPQCPTQESAHDQPAIHGANSRQLGSKPSHTVGTSSVQQSAGRVLLPSPVHTGQSYTQPPVQPSPGVSPILLGISPKWAMGPDPRQTVPHPDPRQTVPYPDPRQAVPRPDPRQTVPRPDPRQAVPRPDPRQTVPHPDPRQTVPHPDPRQTVPRPDPRRTVPHPDPRQTVPHPDPRQTVPHPDPRQAVPRPDPRQTVPHLDPRRTVPHPDPRQPIPGPYPRWAVAPDPRQTVPGPGFRQTVGPYLGQPISLDRRQVIGPDPRIGYTTGPTSARQTINPEQRRVLLTPPSPNVRSRNPSEFEDLPHVNTLHPSQHPLHTSDPLSEKFPNPSVNLEDETFLPSHVLFRRDLVGPKVPAGALSLPRSTKKSGAKDSKEKLVTKVNSKVEEMIEELSSKGKYLPLDAINNIVRELVAKANQGVPYNDRIHWRSIKAQEQYSKLHGRVEELIKVFCWFNPITSLYELERAVVEAENVESYEALHLGPLLKHPKVKDLFKPPDDLEIIPDMTAFKIQMHLMAFLSRRRKHGSKHSLEDFLEFLRAKEFQDSINHLCIRISSFPLALQINFKFRASQTRSRQRMEAAVEEELKTMIQHETEKLKRKFILHNDEDPLSIRRDLKKKDPVQILESVFEACMKNFTSSQQAKVSTFMQSITRTPVLRHLFLLSIYEGAYGADKLLPKFIEEERSVNSQASSSGAAVRHDLYYRPEGDVLKDVLTHLRRVPFPIDIAALARVEQAIVETYGAPSFNSFGNESFLHFIACHEKAVEALGGKLIGSTFSVAHVSVMKQKVKALIGQLKHDKRQDQDIIPQAITTQFGVHSLEDLGCGNIEKLIADVHLLPSRPSPISYVAPILVNSTTPTTDTHHSPPSQKAVGILGHQTREDALACLRKAPLLEDLKEWSHWELVYQPQLGDLAEFLSKELEAHNKHAVYALETSPGKLLRIDENSSVSDFTNALNARHPNPVAVTGHLVSLIVKRNSTQDISPQLLASHVTTSLERMMVDKSTPSGSAVAEKFVFHCLVRIPFSICKNIANELFIDPLRKVASSSAVDGLLKQCGDSTKHRQLLQALGMSIGIKSWSDDFKKMLEEADQLSCGEPFDDEMTQGSGKPLQTLPSYGDNQTLGTAVVGSTTLLSGVSTSNGETPTDTNTVDSDTNLTSTDEPVITVEESVTEEQLEQREAECKQIIEDIRHDEFGIGIELDAKQQQFAEKQRLREGRGIKRLSLELYTKDTHFVLELIQNADDNNYPQLLSVSGEVPSLKFVVDTKSISVMNNEVGFSEKNVRAICDVGKSTKGVHRSGYIGQKGIGFKSVFRITNIPEIHSNGFHILFDASSDPIGFILPHWISHESSHYGDLLQGEALKWRTNIILPLKEDHLTSNMTKKFSDIQPSLLLFLNRLRNITIDDQVCGNVRIMERCDRENGVTEITHSNGTRKETDRWLVVRRVLNKAKEFKPEVEATEIALALPLPPDLTSIPLSKDLQHQQVFAFLPLRSYGFRFIVQGDFDLPSSREDVNADSPWNQWLREELPSLFLDTLQRIKELPGISLMDAVALFLQFVPLEGELHDFFLPLTGQILNLIKGTNCLPSDPLPQNMPTLPTFRVIVSSSSPSNTQDEIVSWKQPSQLLYVKEQFSFIREHIPQCLLTRALNLSYLHSSLLSFINPSLQYHLGIGNLTVDHLIEVMQAALKLYKDEIASNTAGHTVSDAEWSMMDAYDEDSEYSEEEDCTPRKFSSRESSRSVFITWIANWLACVHMIMEDTSDMSSSTVEKLKLLCVIPMEDGTLSSTVEGSLFFPPDYNTKGEKEDSSREFKDIYKEMKVVDLSLFREGSDLVQLRVRKMLELLGVKNLYPSEIINFHILPQFKQELWKKKPQSLLATYLVYIKECIDHRGYGISEADMVRQLKDCVALVTNCGPKLPSKEVVHFSSSYGCDPDLEKLFPDVKWTTVKPLYLKKSQKKEIVSSWVSFLVKLGVKKGLAVHQVEKELPEDSPQLTKLREKIWRRLPGGALTIRDWESEELEQIMDSVSNKAPSQQLTQMKRLAELLDKHWDGEYKQYMEAKIFDDKNETYLDVNDASSFQQCLVQRSWLPASENAKFAPQKSKILYRGCDLFDRVHKVQSLLHNHVPYIVAELKSNDFVKLLGIKGSISARELVDFLSKWSQHSSESQTPFVTSIEHMRSVYVSLMQQADSSQDADSVLDRFREDDLIFVPDSFQEGSASQDVPGHFYTIHNTCWLDSSTVLYNKQKYNRPLPSNLPKVLQLYYYVSDDANRNRTIQQAFELFGVPETPRVATFGTLLKYISSQSASPEPQHVDDFTSITSEFVRLCTRENNPIGPQYVYSNLKLAKVFPSHNRVWVSLEECLLEKDSDEIARCFSENKEVHFLQWPTKPVGRKGQNHNARVVFEEMKEEFTRICKIPKLSMIAKPRLDVSGEIRPLDEVKRRLSLWVSLVQRFIASSCENQYEKLNRENIQEKLLSKLQVFSALSVKCRYFIEHLDSQIASGKSLESGCDFTAEDGVPTIYIAANKTEKLGCLLKALMKLFMNEALDEEREAFERFLTRKLLLETPTTETEVQELALERNIPPLSNEQPVWTIPLPLYMYQTVVQEESSTESEVESEDEELLETSTDQNNPQQNDGGLKSWPPRAAVDPTDSPHKTHFPGKRDVSDIENKNKDSSADVIGEKEIKEARKKHLQEGEEESDIHLQTPQVARQIFPGNRATIERPDSVPPSTVHPRDHTVPPGTAAAAATARSTTVESEQSEPHANVSSGQYPPSSTGHGEVGRNNEVPPPHLVTTSESSHSSDNVRATASIQALKEKRSPSRWHPHQQADSESLDLVDLHDIVQSVQSATDTPVVPFIEIPDDDPASRVEVGRWGEKFVFTLLSRKRCLPDGRVFKSIVWVNENIESGKPYDIQVELDSSNETVYIEVKSTAADKKELVAISWKEIKFAESHKKDYHLYRVYNAGKSTHRLCLRENLYEYLENHPVRFFFML